MAAIPFGSSRSVVSTNTQALSYDYEQEIVVIIIAASFEPQRICYIYPFLSPNQLKRYIATVS